MSTSWTKETALAELKELAKYTSFLAKQYPFCAEHTRWIVRTLAVLEEVFGRKSRYFLTFASFTWQVRGTLLVNIIIDDVDEVLREKNQQAYVRQLDSARGLLMAAMEHVERAGLSEVYEGTNTAPESNTIMALINLADRKLRQVVRKKPEAETEVQDAFESLLVGAAVPYKRETERIEYSSKTYIPDFTVPKINLAIELKLCNRQGREKEIIGEVNDDIRAYQTKYGNLLFVIYDLGFIRDVDRFTGAFEENQSVVVLVVKH
jgi:hypothetical protein